MYLDVLPGNSSGFPALLGCSCPTIALRCCSRSLLSRQIGGFYDGAGLLLRDWVNGGVLSQSISPNERGVAVVNSVRV